MDRINGRWLRLRPRIAPKVTKEQKMEWESVSKTRFSLTKSGATRTPAGGRKIRQRCEREGSFPPNALLCHLATPERNHRKAVSVQQLSLPPGCDPPIAGRAVMRSDLDTPASTLINATVIAAPHQDLSSGSIYGASDFAPGNLAPSYPQVLLAI
jgi:hypothetical protein